MTLRPDAAGALIGEMNRRLESLRAATYEGRDRAGLAIVTVDGEGLVRDVTLARSIARNRPEEVGDAIRDAVTAAQIKLAEAFESLTSEAESWLT